ETASVAFTRATASAGLQLGGDYIFTPTTARQAADTRRLLETDRTRLGAPLSPRVWVAFFRGRTPGRTEVYYRSAPDTAGVALWDERGVAAALAAARGRRSPHTPRSMASRRTSAAWPAMWRATVSPRCGRSSPACSARVIPSSLSSRGRGRRRTSHSSDSCSTRGDCPRGATA